jgi:hypothetical protein
LKERNLTFSTIKCPNIVLLQCSALLAHYFVATILPPPLMTFSKKGREGERYRERKERIEERERKDGGRERGKKEVEHALPSLHIILQPQY